MTERTPTDALPRANFRHLVDAIYVFLGRNGIRTFQHRIMPFNDGKRDVDGGLRIVFDAEVRAATSKYLRRQITFHLHDTFIHKYDRDDYGRTLIARSLGDSIGYDAWVRERVGIEVPPFRYVVYNGVHMGENLMLTMVLSYVKGEPIDLGNKRTVEHKSTSMANLPAVQLLWVDGEGNSRAKVRVVEGVRSMSQIIRDRLASDRERDASWDSGFRLPPSRRAIDPQESRDGSPDPTV